MQAFLGSRGAGRPPTEKLTKTEASLWRKYCDDVLTAANVTHQSFSSRTTVYRSDGKKRKDGRWFVKLQSAAAVPVADARSAVIALSSGKRTRAEAAKVHDRVVHEQPSANWWRWLVESNSAVLPSREVVQRRGRTVGDILAWESAPKAARERHPPKHSGRRLVRSVSAVVPDHSIEDFAVTIAATLEDKGVICNADFAKAIAAVTNLLEEYALRNARLFADDLGRFLDRPQKNGSRLFDALVREVKARRSAPQIGSWVSHAVINEVFAERAARDDEAEQRAWERSKPRRSQGGAARMGGGSVR